MSTLLIISIILGGLCTLHCIISAAKALIPIERRVFIIGPIFGHQLDDIKTSFAQADADLRLRGFLVVSSLRLPHLHRFMKKRPDPNYSYFRWDNYQDYMREDVTAQMKCGYVYILPGSEHCNVCQSQIEIAAAVGCTRIDAVKERAVTRELGAQFRPGKGFAIDNYFPS